MGWLFPSLLFFFVFACSSSLGQPWDGVVITQADYQGLQAFKRALVDRRGFLKSWNDSGTGACSGGWQGIKCAQGQVISIQLPWRGLRGRISEGISQLAALRKLNLHDNLLEGPVPETLGFLPNLRGVYLFNNRLSGSIPPSIARCPLLQTLDLSSNSLSGPIPAAIASSKKLYRLNLSFNNLSGEIPVGIAQSPSLTFLSLHKNLLSGVIPDSWGGSGHRLQTLTLDDNSFSGSLPPSIGKLQILQIFTVSNNRINGSIPAEFSNLTAAVQLNLAGNLIAGEIPAAIGELKNISLLSLKSNKLQGSIPATIGNISGISYLDFSDNNFTGEIPSSLAGLSNLSFFNVSDNDLSGPVPPLLSEKFNSSSFSGNLRLCGFKGSAPCSPPPTLPPVTSETPAAAINRRRTHKLSLKDIILIVIGSILLVLLILCCVLLVCLIKKRKELKNSTATTSRGEKSTGTSGGGADVDSGGDAGGKLVHFDGPLVFTADDLLCATAEIMGKSTYGTVYKATLEDGNQVAVKRLREKIAKNHREFETEVNALGKIRHPNLLSLRAYYLGPKGEKLLVFDFMPKGSLAAFLHARGPDTPVDWATRMKIMVGTARGLHHLHTKENTVHGNLTSGNILLDEEVNAKIADYGLSKLMSAAANSNVIATAGALGYRAPELSKLKKASVKTDMYSLGVVMLELLTGKSPGEAMNGVDLPQWVASIVKEEWTNEVFDLELMRDAEGTTGDELLNTLKLALHCVDPSPTARPEVNQVLRQLEEVKPELAGGAASSSAAKVVGDDGEEDPIPGSTSPPTVEEMQKQ